MGKKIARSEVSQKKRKTGIKSERCGRLKTVRRGHGARGGRAIRER